MVWGGRSKGVEDSFGCFSCSSIGRGEEVERI